jgi:hypothetical protein
MGQDAMFFKEVLLEGPISSFNKNRTFDARGNFKPGVTCELRV